MVVGCGENKEKKESRITGAGLYIYENKIFP